MFQRSSTAPYSVWGYVPVTGIAAALLARESFGIRGPVAQRGTVAHLTSTRVASRLRLRRASQGQPSTGISLAAPHTV